MPPSLCISLYTAHQDTSVKVFEGWMCSVLCIVFLLYLCVRSGSRLMLSVVMAMAFHLAFSQSHSHRSIPVPIAGSVRLKPRLCPIGLPGDHGVVSGPRDIRRAVCANGHGSGHCLQQCARLRPQHWRRHGSERHHWCKWGWGTTSTHQPIASDAFGLPANRIGVSTKRKHLSALD